MHDDETIPCPNCGQPMYDDSPRCPACGHYPTDADFKKNLPPWLMWIIILMILAMVLPFLWPFLTGR